MKLKTIEREQGGIYQQIEKLSVGLKKSQLDPSKLTELEKPSKELAEFLDCTVMQATLFTVILALNFHRGMVGIEEIASYLNCNPLTIVKYIPEFAKLVKKRLIRADTRGNQRKSVLNDINYYITRDVIDAMFQGDISLIRSSTKMDLAELLMEIKGLAEERHFGKLTYDEMLEDIRDTTSNNEQLQFTQRIYSMGLDVDEALILLYLCAETYLGMETVDLSMA